MNIWTKCQSDEMSMNRWPGAAVDGASKIGEVIAEPRVSSEEERKIQK